MIIKITDTFIFWLPTFYLLWRHLNVKSGNMIQIQLDPSGEHRKYLSNILLCPFHCLLSHIYNVNAIVLSHKSLYTRGSLSQKNFIFKLCTYREFNVTFVNAFILNINWLINIWLIFDYFYNRFLIPIRISDNNNFVI